jgi:hypothetical protein
MSRYCYIVNSTCAVSRYKLDRSQKFITMQDLNCGQMCVSGCNDHYEFVLRAGVKAKTMTSLLILTGVVSKSVVSFLVMQDVS